MDVFDKRKRSRIMGKIKGKHTKPEILVRSMLHKMGYRFRLHRKDLPGNPDITLPKFKKVIFVNGCFWHGHENCKRSKRPATNSEFWNEKLNKNIRRDKKNIQELNEKGWEPLIIWTCEIKNEKKLKQKLGDFLKDRQS
ncbi:putative very short patch repair endonuclease [Candidatus Desulfarcum epimagneticum]|uniref:Very short patch repair endonuclease n=1 Tax=uncultured Desulfobacteraceae bacterium TaxID=218296 RepID=A0A484HC25_9BACT|nr:putative very short patch repair endonuclease [uncultured Desulfobacteraceae bacterium]